LEDRELNQARSKPDTVDRPVRTASIFVHHCISTQYRSTVTVFIYIPLPPHQHHISDVANWRQGGGDQCGLSVIRSGCHSICAQDYCKSNQPISLKLGVMIGPINR